MPRTAQQTSTRTPQRASAGHTPRVGVLMGSESDWPVMEQAVKTLQQFGVAYEARVLSAHRCPELVREYAKSAAARGLSVLIAGAGGAAHLAGTLAAQTTLPIIGVPMESKSLKGLDSLLSTVQMPKGIPVATVAIDGAVNAAILAVQCLALSDAQLRQALADHRAQLLASAQQADQRLPRS